MTTGTCVECGHSSTDRDDFVDRPSEIPDGLLCWDCYDTWSVISKATDVVASLLPSTVTMPSLVAQSIATELHKAGLLHEADL